MDLADIDLKDRKTQIMLVGAALVVGLLLSKLRGKPAGDEGPDAQRIVVEYNSDPGGPAYNGTFPQAPPIFSPAPGGGGLDLDPDPPITDPDPPKTTTPKPLYSCPAGSRIAKESNGSGNDVCLWADGHETRVIMGSTGLPWTPADDKPAKTTPKPKPSPLETKPSGKPYSCPAGSRIAKESNGSGNDVCLWDNGRETSVIMNSTGQAWGVGGDGPPARGTVRGLASSAGGFSPFPAAITATRDYTVQQGDTLASIAGRILGAPQRWPQLLELNPELRGVRRLKAGSTLRVS